MSLSISAPAVSRATPRTRANRARASPSPRASSPRAMDVVSTTLIVDDLVFHDGSTVMERLGGGGPQTLFGALCHRDGASARVGIVAGVGEDDCPESSRRWLVERGVDVDGLLAVSGASTPRAWQITERDGRRTQVWREEASEGLYAMLRPEFASWPEKCRRTRAVHFGINPARPDVTLVGALRNAGCGLISIEPFTHAATPLSASALRELMSLGDVWSPNERESKSFFADGETMSPEELVGRMRDAGANKVICLRRGALGAVAYDARTGEGYACEAFPVSRVVDETGCGNCFCGAFAASVLAGDGLRDALTLASAAASIMVEHIGVPNGSIDEYRALAATRARAVDATVTSFSVA